LAMTYNDTNAPITMVDTTSFSTGLVTLAIDVSITPALHAGCTNLLGEVGGREEYKVIEAVKSGKYSRSGIFTDVSHPFFEIKGKKWGIIGLGAIGRGVANIAKTFGCEVCYYSTSGVNRNKEFQRTTLEQMLQECDIITIHAPLNEKTTNLLDYEKLATCKEGAVVLNLGRGGIIDEDAVAKLVDEKNIAFGLDVFENEPLPQESPLLHVKNKERLYLTPHIAWTSIEARAKLIAGVCENIKSSL